MKPKPAPAFSWEEIDALRVETGCVTEERRPGGFTVHEYMGRYKVSRSTAREQLGLLVHLGAMESTLVRAADTIGRLVPFRVYYPAKGAICGGSISAGSKKTIGRKCA